MAKGKKSGGGNSNATPSVAKVSNKAKGPGPLAPGSYEIGMKQARATYHSGNAEEVGSFRQWARRRYKNKTSLSPKLAHIVG